MKQRPGATALACAGLARGNSANRKFLATNPLSSKDEDDRIRSDR